MIKLFIPILLLLMTQANLSGVMASSPSAPTLGQLVHQQKDKEKKLKAAIEKKEQQLKKLQETDRN